MDRAVFDPSPSGGRLETPGSKAQMADLYAAAAARIVVTSKRRFVTVCGVRRLTGEAMTVDCVPSAGVSELEAAAVILAAHERSGTDPHAGLDERSTRHSATTVFDPEVLLAWLLTEGLSAFH